MVLLGRAMQDPRRGAFWRFFSYKYVDVLLIAEDPRLLVSL